jgi:hypothetical protein
MEIGEEFCTKYLGNIARKKSTNYAEEIVSFKKRIFFQRSAHVPNNIVHIWVEEKWGECICLSAGAYTPTLYGSRYSDRGWACTPTLTSLG